MTDTPPSDRRGKARYDIREAIDERPHGRKLSDDELDALASLLAAIAEAE